MNWLKLKTPGKFTSAYVWYGVFNRKANTMYRFWPGSFPRKEMLRDYHETLEELERKFSILILEYKE